MHVLHVINDEIVVKADAFLLDVADEFPVRSVMHVHRIYNQGALHKLVFMPDDVPAEAANCKLHAPQFLNARRIKIWRAMLYFPPRG